MRQLHHAVRQPEALRFAFSLDEIPLRQRLQQTVQRWPAEANALLNIDHAKRPLIGREALQDRDRAVDGAPRGRAAFFGVFRFRFRARLFRHLHLVFAWRAASRALDRVAWRDTISEMKSMSIRWTCKKRLITGSNFIGRLSRLQQVARGGIDRRFDVDGVRGARNARRDRYFGRRGADRRARRLRQRPRPRRAWLRGGGPTLGPGV